MIILIVLAIFAFILLSIISISFICYRIIFYSSPKKRSKKGEEYSFPNGEIYLPYLEQIKEYIRQVRSMPCKHVEIKSFDNLTLRGRYFEYSKGAPIEIIFHGYRGDSESDVSGGVIRCFSLKRNALIVDQRAGGKSDGKVITFGVNESKDCLPWVNYILKNINKYAEIYLCGVSMGAATVLIASQYDMPSNVKGIIADCGYTSAKDMITKVIEEMKLPVFIFYPLAKLGAKLFGKFNLEETSPIVAVKKSKLPILLIHGNNDILVPHYMSIKNYQACASPNKKLLIVENAGHGLAYLISPQKYVNSIKEFEREIKNFNKTTNITN